MENSRFLKTAKLGIVLQVTDTKSPGKPGRAWEVHDVERNRGFRVILTGQTLHETPRGKKPIGREFTEGEIDGGLGLAIERTLVTPPEKIAGTLYDVSVTSQDLYDFVALKQ